MNWRNPKKELPKQDQKVWVMLEPHKERGSLQESAMSIQIVCGEVCHGTYGDTKEKYCIIENYDELGWGSLSWKLAGAEDGTIAWVIAWLPVEEMVYPDWVAE